MAIQIDETVLPEAQTAWSAPDVQPPRQMRTPRGVSVLMLLQNNPYPQDRRVRPEAAALTDAGYDVTVIAPAAPGQRWHEVVDGVHAYRYPAPPDIDGVLGFASQYAYSLAMTSLLSVVAFARRRFQVVHTHNPPDIFVFVAAFYKLFGARFVFDHHDLSPEMYRARFGARSRPLVYRVLVWLEKLSCRLADHVIATNASYKAIETGRGGVPPEHVTIVRNGPSLDRVRPVEPDPQLRRTGKVIIGYVGTMGFQDGIDYLLRALRHLAYDLRRTDFLCVLIGSGDAQTGLKALATELQLDEYVRFTGRIPDGDLLRYLSAADICVDPDPSNPFNDRSSMIKMSEYMALAKPIVAFDLPEHRVTAQDAASYVSPNDEAAFARALADLMDDPERRARMGTYGRRRVESALAWPYSIPCLLSAYDTLLGSASVPRERPLARPARSWPFRKVRQWAGLRGPRYIVTRLATIRSRYGMTSSRAKKRLLACMAALARYDCRPTFPTPGAVVRRNSRFCQQLQRCGAELAVHGYHHVDFRALTVSEARRQFARAAATYHRYEIDFEGFRCPYLSCTEDVYAATTGGELRYSSNAAIWWDVLSTAQAAGVVFEKLSRLYQPAPSHSQPAVPRLVGGLVEIPVCLPDDLQLLDGLGAGVDVLRRAWTELLRQTHRRGELFDLLFHPESFDECAAGLEAVLREAQNLRPAVWIAQLRDISRWWHEKAGFTVERIPDENGLRLVFHCSDRATILLRGLDGVAHTRRWCGSYRELESRTVQLAPDLRPFIGVAPDTPPDLIGFLEEQGYLVDSGPDASRCATYVEGHAQRALNRVELIERIERSPAPLVRFWRWPAGARSALCLTGDLDALSLVDYAARVFAIR